MRAKKRTPRIAALTVILFLSFPNISVAWHDETHLAIAKAAGYQKWYNAAGPDIAKIKAGDKEGYNHYSNNPPDTVVTPEMVLAQVNRYNDPTDENGHLYGAIVASLRDYRSAKAEGKYGEYTSPTALITWGTHPCRSTIPCMTRITCSITRQWTELSRMRY